MAASDKERQNRRAGSLGAVSLRLVVALGASTGLTAAVALPMAYQAQQAREQDQVARQRQQQPSVEVLGTTTLPSDTGVAQDGLYWVRADVVDEAVELHRSTLTGSVRIVVDLPAVERVDFRLNNDPVVSVTNRPWEFPDAGLLDTAALGEGDHVLVTTIQFDDGRNELRRAEFAVSTG